MRFLFDEDIAPAVAQACRRLGLDAVSVHDLGRRGHSDAAQLSFAAAERRVLVTRNRDDFIRLTTTFFQTGQAHAGVLILGNPLANSRPGGIARALYRRQARATQEDHAYLLEFLGER